MMVIHSVLFVIGLGILLFGADLLVRNSSLLARSLGVKPIIVGLTIVAFGTSAPEFGVSFMAALTKAKPIAIGNIIGSNIANIGLILGLTSLIRPLHVERKTLWRELPWVLGTAVLLLLLCLDGEINWIDGIVLLVFFALFLFYCFRKRTSREIEGTRIQSDGKGRLRRSLLTVLGLGLLLGGGTLLVRSAVYIAGALKISPLVIGLTVVSVGTSLPELATTVVAAVRKESAIGVGNIIGSNVFNTCWVVGCAVLVATISVEPISLWFDMPFMILMSLLLFPFFITGLRISRFEGLVLLLLYGLYFANCFFSFHNMILN